MAEYTANYNLEKQQANEYIRIEGLNENFDKIDEKVKAEVNAVNMRVDDVEEKGVPADGGNADTVNGHTVEVDVPVGAKFTDTVYTHPTTAGNKHIPSGGVAGQVLKYSASGTAAWGEDKDTVYTHPATAGNKHIPAGGASGQILRWSSSGTAVWGAENNTVYTHPSTHPPTILSNGALPAGVVATNSTDYTTSRLRNVRFGTTVPSSLANGEVYMMYE